MATTSTMVVPADVCGTVISTKLETGENAVLFYPNNYTARKLSKVYFKGE